MAYKCECLFVCVILHLQPRHTDLDPSWTSSSDPITPSLRLSTFFHGQYHHHTRHHAPHNQQCFIALCVDKIYNISVKRVMRFELLCGGIQKPEFQLTGKHRVSVFAFLLWCCRFAFQKPLCLQPAGKYYLFLMIFPWKSGSRILIYILHAVVWMPTDRERGNLFIERRDINLGLLQCALPPKAGWQMPNPRLDAQLKLGQSKKNHFKCIL